MGFVDPLIALIISFCLLGITLYKRVNLGASLSLTALLLALLSLDWNTVPFVIFETVTDVSMISVLFASFGIMVMSQLYKETKAIGRLSDSLSKMIHNSKLVVAVLPAIIGLLPVAGGALMSAPLVESEADKLGLNPEKKTYVNIWFRHTIFPVYPISQVLILTGRLTGASVASIIMRQIPVVISMIIVGYFLSLWRAKQMNEDVRSSTHLGLELKKFIVAFSPILATIVVAVFTSLDVSVAVLAGIITLLFITRPNIATIRKPFNNLATYSIALAVFGAFFLRNIVESVGISQIFSSLAINGSNELLLLLIFIGLLFSINQVLFFIGYDLAGAINGSLTQKTSVFFGIILGYLILKERITKLQILFSFLLFLGLSISITQFFTLININLTILIGVGIILLISLMWITGHTLTKPIFSRNEATPIQMVFIRNFISAVVLILSYLIIFTPDLRIFIDPSNLLFFFLMGSVYGAGLVCWYKTLSFLDVSKATTVFAPTPISSAIFATIILGEIFSIAHLVGTIIIIVSIVIIINQKKS